MGPPIIFFTLFAVAFADQNGERGPQDTIDFVRDLHHGDVVSYLRNSESWTLVEYYNPRCPWSREFVEELESLARLLYKHRKRVRVAKMDITTIEAHEFKLEQEILGTPAVCLYAPGSVTPIHLDGIPFWRQFWQVDREHRLGRVLTLINEKIGSLFLVFKDIDADHEESIMGTEVGAKLIRFGPEVQPEGWKPETEEVDEEEDQVTGNVDEKVVAVAENASQGKISELNTTELTTNTSANDSLYENTAAIVGSNLVNATETKAMEPDATNTTDTVGPRVVVEVDATDATETVDPNLATEANATNTTDTGVVTGDNGDRVVVDLTAEVNVTLLEHDSLETNTSAALNTTETVEKETETSGINSTVLELTEPVGNTANTSETNTTVNVEVGSIENSTVELTYAGANDTNTTTQTPEGPGGKETAVSTSDGAEDQREDRGTKESFAEERNTMEKLEPQNAIPDADPGTQEEWEDFEDAPPEGSSDEEFFSWLANQEGR